MSDHEEDFGDVPSENKKESKESMVGAYREDTTSGITTKFHHFMGGHPGSNTES